MPKVEIKFGSVQDLKDHHEKKYGEGKDESKYKGEGLSPKLKKHLEEHKALEKHYEEMEE